MGDSPHTQRRLTRLANNRHRARLINRVNQCKTIFDLWALLYRECEHQDERISDLEGLEHWENIREETQEVAAQIHFIPLGDFILTDSSKEFAKKALNMPSADDSLMAIFGITLAIDRSAFEIADTRFIQVGYSQGLNTNDDIGRVFPKVASKIATLIESTRFKGNSFEKQSAFSSDIRHRFKNLLLVDKSAKIEIERMMTFSLQFPSDARNLIFGIAQLVDDVRQLHIIPTERIIDRRRGFRCTVAREYSDSLTRDAIAKLTSLCESRCTFVVFPELSVPPEAVAELQNLLRDRYAEDKQVPLITVAGTCHRKEGGKWKNIATVLGPNGDILWTCRKHKRFTMNRNDAVKLMELDEKYIGIEEDISVEHPMLVIRDTRVGRIAVAICRDFFDDEMLRYFKAMDVNIVFVPAMSKSLNHFNASARNLGSLCRATSLIANTCSITKRLSNEREPQEVSLFYFPAIKQAFWIDCMGTGKCASCTRIVLWDEGEWITL